MSLSTIGGVNSCPYLIAVKQFWLFSVTFVRLKTHLKRKKQFDVNFQYCVQSEQECKYIYAPMFHNFPGFWLGKTEFRWFMMNKRQTSIALVACKKVKLVSGRESDLSISLILAYLSIRYIFIL